MRDTCSHYPTRGNGDYVAGLACRMLDSEGRRYLRVLHPLATADEQLIGIFAACDLEGRTRV